ncbi:hypothetical protein Dda_4687 [Drechslerella dactyloides]|uniref:Uncharacterized protein n=1 Tax=Drechslerella dactyloides TaxID=74499 RepID=A0AAD6J1L1_DREDA|nr:hypothetical protein Dda_4687 [Drechslerella dactyloides]
MSHSCDKKSKQINTVAVIEQAIENEACSAKIPYRRARDQTAGTMGGAAVDAAAPAIHVN